MISGSRTTERYASFVEKSLASLVPSANDLLQLDVEEVGWVLLVHLASLGQNSGDGRVWGEGRINQYNFFNQLDQQPIYGTRRGDVNRVLMEAWGWLQHEGFLVREVGSGGTESCFLSRRAKHLETRAEFDAYRKAGLLPRGQLHALIAARVYPTFLRGEYDTLSSTVQRFFRPSARWRLVYAPQGDFLQN